MIINRRQMLSTTAAAALTATMNLPALGNEPAAVELPIMGDEVAALASFDKWAREFMTKYEVPGGQLAVARGGKVFYSRGFGYADRDEKSPVQPHSLFRIASVSKPITAVAILRLVQQGKLKLSDRVDDILKIDAHRERDVELDKRWSDITIAHCLAHTGGWDRDASYDPMFAYDRVARSLKMKLPVGTAEIIRYMRGQSLDFAPGEKYAYSNFGYCLLGRVIEKVAEPAGTYDDFVRREVFKPLGIEAPRMGRSLLENRAKDEVHYYTIDDDRATAVVGPRAGDDKHRVPVSYGGWNHEALDAHGGWIASASDLVRFAAAFDDPALRASKPLLSAELAASMFEPQPGAPKYGLGWTLGRYNDHRLIAHGGALPCTAASLIKLPGDVNVAALFNLGRTKDDQWLGRGLDGHLARLGLGIRDWPA
jgi:N-acyl-D-amino-acid deacylase